MTPDNDPHHSAKVFSYDRLAVNILCDVSSLRTITCSVLGASGFQVRPDACVTLLLDVPYGSALRKLPTLDRANHQLIVVTWNTCPEYWEALWESQPAVLLADVALNQELPHALRRAARGERYRRTPPQPTVLTTTERAVLHALARGWDNQRIAGHLGLGKQTVRNMLRSVYGKLGLRTRLEVVYFPATHILSHIDGCGSPEHTGPTAWVRMPTNMMGTDLAA